MGKWGDERSFIQMSSIAAVATANHRLIWIRKVKKLKKKENNEFNQRYPLVSGFPGLYVSLLYIERKKFKYHVC